MKAKSLKDHLSRVILLLLVLVMNPSPTVDAKLANGKWHIFYEFARADGAHDMRVVTCDASELPF